MIVMAICGATSAYGSHADRKTTFFSMLGKERGPLGAPSTALGAVRGFELAQDLVAALLRVVERLLRLLLSGEDRFQLLLDRLAPLHEVAEAKSLGIRGRRLVREHLDRHL